MRKVLDRFAPWLIYPSVMALVFVLFAALISQGATLVVATYTAIVTAAIGVILLELGYPHRAEWRPVRTEVGTDLAFIAVVQMALPPLVGFLFVHLLVEPAKGFEVPWSEFWPHDAPLALQALLMILIVDFLRYWLHRAAHENRWLWRLHAVHHSVERLYWLNTARFHPLEKILQMLLDSLPFLLIGVDERVLSLYYIAYSTNGFFQHSNIRLRFGFLNYVVGSAELHRWHHSRVPGESNTNYGNNLIVWDLLFGTWCLPKDRDLRDVGLLDRDYPKSFTGMLIAPFRSSPGARQ